MSRKRYSAVANHVFGGGMLVGFKAAGVNVIADLETFDIGVKTVRLNFPGLDVRHDPRAESWGLDDFRDVDIVFGNPRCTAFSALTVGLKHRHGACTDATTDIRQSFAIVKKCHPKVFCLESVQGAATIGLELLYRLGDELPRDYRFAIVLVNNVSFGVPQHRKRLFVVGYRDCEYGPGPPKRLRKTVLCRDVMTDLEGVEAGFFKGKSLDWVPLFQHEKKTTGNHVVFNGVVHDENCEQVLPGMSLDDVDPREMTEKFRQKRENGIGFSFHVVRRLHYDYVSPLVYAASHSFLHPGLPRAITVREAARIMRVPDTYLYVGERQYAQVGNGVSPSTSRWVASTLVEALNGEHEDAQYKWDMNTGELRETPGNGERWKRFEFTRLVPLDYDKLVERQKRYIKDNTGWKTTEYGKQIFANDEVVAKKRREEKKDKEARGVTFDDDHGTVEVR